MQENVTASAPDPDSDADADAMARAVGLPRYNRRLGDKVLAAFNHAYAIGSLEVAAQLRDVLARIEADRGEDYGERRYSATTLGQADLWMAFVEARNDFQSVSDDEDADPQAVADAMALMKKTYAEWSAG